MKEKEERERDAKEVRKTEINFQRNGKFPKPKDIIKVQKIKVEGKKMIPQIFTS